MTSTTCDGRFGSMEQEESGLWLEKHDTDLQTVSNDEVSSDFPVASVPLI